MKGLLKANTVQLGLRPDDYIPLVKDTNLDALLSSERDRWALHLKEQEAAKMSEEAMEMSETSRQEANRRKILQACFHRDARTIQAEFERIYRWHMNPELEPAHSEMNAEAKDLQHLFKEARLPSSLRRSCVEGSLQRVTQEQDPESPDFSIFADCAHEAEMTACLSYLNFVRKLCGLSEVTWSHSKRVVCQTICQALLPRTKTLEDRGVGDAPLKSSEKDPTTKFAEAVARTVQNVDGLNVPVSILHGEGSLVTGMEQSVGAAHMCKLPRTKKAQDPAMTAWNIAQSVAGGTEKTDEKFLDSVADGGAMARRATQISSQDLPPVLEHLKVFWDLRPGIPPPEQPAQKMSTEAPSRGTSTGASPRSSRVRRRPLHKSAVHCTREAQIVASHFGLDAVWGDRRGALSFRRCLLSPSLTSFGAARYDDTCVLWTGKDYDETGEDGSNGGQPVTAKEAPQQRFDAVCFPPPGLVPLQLVEGRKTPWTIMPNSTQFQPTDEKDIPVNAVRLEEVAVNGFAVDCSTKGEPFCIIYWPDIDNMSAGASLEVQLTGLCGRHNEITMFHELMSFRRRAAPTRASGSASCKRFARSP